MKNTAILPTGTSRTFSVSWKLQIILFFILFPLYSIAHPLFIFCSDFDALLEAQEVDRGKNLIQRYKLQASSLLYGKQNWNITSGTDFMAFLVKALVSWNECYQHFEQLFGTFFQIVSSQYREILPSTIYMLNLNQLDHPDRNYRGDNLPSLAIPICKKPGLFRVKVTVSIILSEQREQS